jgi:hypothetical protein
MGQCSLYSSAQCSSATQFLDGFEASHRQRLLFEGADRALDARAAFRGADKAALERVPSKPISR